MARKRAMYLLAEFDAGFVAGQAEGGDGEPYEYQGDAMTLRQARLMLKRWYPAAPSMQVVKLVPVERNCELRRQNRRGG